MDLREIGWEVLASMRLAKDDMDQRQAVVNMVMNLRVPKRRELLD